MTKHYNKLSARQVETVKTPGVYADGGCLYLRVGKGVASRSWIAIYHFQGKRREMGLGPLSGVTLASARQRAAEVRRQVAEGIDPLEARRTTKVIPTFGEVADAWIIAKSKGIRGDKTVARWNLGIGPNGYAAPFRDKRVDQVTTADILGVLMPIWQSKPEIAKKTRGYIESVLDASKVQGHRSGDNPARWGGHLEHLLAEQLKRTVSHSAVPWREMPALMAGLRGRNQSTSCKSLQALILTATRTSEILGCVGREVNLETRVWTIPPERMKEAEAHEIPLSDAAVALFRSIKYGPDDLVFTGARGGRMSDDALLKFLQEDLGRSETVHGFRSSFRDWAGDATDYPEELAEWSLAHKFGDSTKLAYRRGRALERRRPLMQSWSDYLAGKVQGTARIPVAAV